MKKLHFVALFLLTAIVFEPFTPANAQQNRNTLERSDIQRIAIDTLPTDRADVHIVTFTDNTFRFIHAYHQRFREADVYRSNWDTVNLFACRKVDLATFADTVLLNFRSANALIPNELDGPVFFHSPAQGNVVSKYGPRGRRAHQGTDIQVWHGQPIFAAFDGIVRISRWNSGGYGNVVIVRHPDGLETYYAHLSRRAVAADEFVRAGQVVGYGGKTGRAFGNHLHFETRFADQSFDPERIFDFKGQRLQRGVETDFALAKSYFDPSARSGRDSDGGNDFVDANGDLLAENGRETPSGGTSAASGSTAAASGGSPAASKTTSAASKASSGAVHHTIKSGDTLFALALKYGTTVAKICDLNGITRTTTLKIDRKLRIK